MRSRPPRTAPAASSLAEVKSWTDSSLLSPSRGLSLHYCPPSLSPMSPTSSMPSSSMSSSYPSCSSRSTGAPTQMALTPTSTGDNAALMTASVIGVWGKSSTVGNASKLTRADTFAWKNCGDVRLRLALCGCASRQGVPAHTKVSFNLTTAHHNPGHLLVDSIQTRQLLRPYIVAPL
jgi:hypothetical protein